MFLTKPSAMATVEEIANTSIKNERQNIVAD